jgi:hypothetical protein
VLRPSPASRAVAREAPSPARGEGKISVTGLLTTVSVLVTFRPNLAHIGRGPGGIPELRGECGARGRTCNPLPGGIGHQPAGTMTGARGAIAGLGQVRAGNARNQLRKVFAPGWGERTGSSALAASQEAWLGAEPLATRVPLARAAVERRQSCASRLRRGRARLARQITIASVGVSPPNLFLSWPAPSLTLPRLRGRERVGEFAKRLKRKTKVGTTPAFFFALRLRASRDGFGKTRAHTRRENEIAFPLPPTRAARGGEGSGVGGLFLVHSPPRLIALLRSSPALPTAKRGEGNESASRERPSISSLPDLIRQSMRPVRSLDRAAYKCGASAWTTGS